MSKSNAGDRTVNDSAATMPPHSDRAAGPKAIQQILDDQRQSWLRGQRSSVEDYLQWMPQLSADSSAIVELLVGEFRLRQELGEAPLRSEFERRFPEHTARLRQQLLAAGIDVPDTDLASDRVPALGPGGTVSNESVSDASTHVGDSADSSLTVGDPTENRESHSTEAPTSLIEASEALARELAARQASGRAESPDRSTIVQLLKEALKGSSPTRTRKRGPTPMRAVPGYDIVAELGRGSVGVVYKARQAGLNRVVALKMILAGGHASRTTLARFRAEAEAVASLQHGNIVQVYETGECDGLPFFSLEFCAGGSLADRLDGTPLSAETAARTIVKLARAMHYAHGCKVVHRDLKPGNILLHPKDDDGRPAERKLSDEAFDFESIILKVSDFGLAKRLDEESQTKTGAILGTPSYMAPEQASGQIHDVGPPADIYALGAVLYELLTGRPPFRAATPLDTVVQVINDEPVPPRRLHSGVPVDLETVALKCLQKDPLKRYLSAADLADDVQRFLDGEPIVARPVGLLERTWRWCRRNPVIAGLSALAATLLVAGTIVSLYFAKQATERAVHSEKNEQQAKAERESARRNQYVAEMNLVQRAWHDVEMSRVRSLLQSQVPASESVTDFRGPEWHYWNRRANAELAVVPVEIGESPCLALSPDGSTLAAAGSSRAVIAWNIADWRELARFTDHTGSIVGLAFLPDGRLVSAGTAHGVGDRGPFVKGKEVRLWSVAQRKQLESILSPGDAELEKFAVSHDGTRFALADRNGSVTVAKFGDGAAIRSFDGTGIAALTVAFAPDGQRLAAGFSNGDVTVWNIESGTVVKSFKQSRSVAHCVAFSPEGRRLVVGGSGIEEKDVGFRRDGDIRILNLDTDRSIAELHGHTGPVLHVEFSPDGRRLVSGGNDRTIRIWDAISGKSLAVLQGNERSTTAAVFGKGGRNVYSIGDDRALRVWDASSSDELWPYGGSSTRPSVIALSHDGKSAALVDTDSAPGPYIAIHELPSKQPRERLPTAGKRILAVAWRPTERHLAMVVSAESGQSLWLRAADGMDVWNVKIGVENATTLLFTSDGRQLAVIGSDRAVIFDTNSGKLIGEYATATGQIVAATFLPGAALRLVSSDGAKVTVWDSADPGSQQGLDCGVDPIVSAAISRDGTIVATAFADRTIRLWDAATGRDLLGKKLTGHVDKVAALAFSPDGRRLASSGMGYDHTTRNWDTASGQELLVLTSNVGDKPQLTFSSEWLAVCRDRAEFWDFRPVDATDRTERAAHAVARYFLSQTVEHDAAVQAIAADRAISDDVRRLAVEAIQQWNERPIRFEQAAWSVVRSPYESAAEYGRAVEWARHSTAATSNHGKTILGAALFRAGRFAEADTLLADGTRLASGENWDLVRRVFLALNRLSLGRSADAKDMLAQLDGSSIDGGGRELLRELREQIERVERKQP